MERRERVSVLSRMAKKEEMARGIVRGVLEQVDTIHMVRAIILEEVNRLDDGQGQPGDSPGDDMDHDPI